MNISATLYYTGTVLQAHAGSAKAAIGLYSYMAKMSILGRKSFKVALLVYMLQ